MFKIHLRRLLSDIDWNIAELYRATGGDAGGVCYNTLLAYYHEYIKRVNIVDLVKICDALDCKLSDLMEYDPNKK
jgi:DNA-binding Xre family transcriptional regulator